MNEKHGPWTIKSREKAFENDFIAVVDEEVINPDRSEGRYATVRLQPGVCILPVDDDGNVYLVSQFRYAVGRESLEVVAGGLDGDDPAEGARRELREEIGIHAGELIDLGSVDMDTSIVRCPVRFFVARKLKIGKPEREGTEVMRTEKLKFSDAVDRVMDGRITHSLSVGLILKWQARQANSMQD